MCTQQYKPSAMSQREIRFRDTHPSFLRCLYSINGYISKNTYPFFPGRQLVWVIRARICCVLKNKLLCCKIDLFLGGVHFYEFYLGSLGFVNIGSAHELNH